jgi:hypothetical protein
MAERRRQGLCFNCDEKYVRGHHCSHLFFIEYDNEAADDEDSWQRAEESTEPVISLYAVTGITSGETMRLAVGDPWMPSDSTCLFWINPQFHK